ncbi:ABC-type polysaccharide/polyol phosphate export permease [Bacilli bacterium PM5-3]|nr:ABC-type polysaccharide/polyol phosphate export permease [Bacilli bacterium PM5-3]
MVKEVKYFFKEHINNKDYIWKLAVSRAKEDTQKTTLGMYWNVVKDAVFFVAYGFFMMAIRGGNKDIEGMPKLIYLFTGLVAWYFISDSLNKGVACITRNKKIFSKIKFPILIIPTYETIAIFIRRLSSLALLAVVLIGFMVAGLFTPNINIFGLIYSLVASFLFGVSYNLLVSGFYTISKDFRELYKAIVRIQFYFIPIFWSVYSDIPKFIPFDWAIGFFEKLPFVHLIISFRRSITLGEFPALINIATFAGIVLVMFVAGCYIQYRLRRIYADFV